MLPRVVFLTVSIVAAVAANGEAQSTVPTGRARVVGTVVDSLTGRPIIRSQICRDVDLGAPYGRAIVCTSPDTAGRYVLDSLPGGSHVLTASCVGLALRQLGHDTLKVADGAEARFDVRTSAAGCNMRPFILRRAVFEGHYTSGFEESRFRPCNDSIYVWTEISRDAFASTPKWPETGDSYNRTYFVRWRGTLRGPWRYGHMGVSAYEISVDSILAIRRPRPSDCR